MSKLILTMVGLSWALSFASAGPEHAVGQSIRVGALTRKYLLHVPPTLDRTSPAPLVFAFHGSGGTARIMQKKTRFCRLSDQHGFIVVYPNGVDGRWEARVTREEVDDIAFVQAMIQTLSASYKVDAQRIYSCGFSNGGTFTHRLGVELRTTFAAIASVGSTIQPESVALLKKDGPPLPVLTMSGTADPLRPYDGGQAKRRGRTGRSNRPAIEVPEIWARHNGCLMDAELTWLPDKDPRDGKRVFLLRYKGGRDGTRVDFYTIKKGKHRWPGKGRGVCRDIDASVAIWKFFEEFRRAG